MSAHSDGGCGRVVGVWCMERKVAGLDLAVDVDFFFVSLSKILVGCLFEIAARICVIIGREI